MFTHQTQVQPHKQHICTSGIFTHLYAQTNRYNPDTNVPPESLRTFTHKRIDTTQILMTEMLIGTNDQAATASQPGSYTHSNPLLAIFIPWNPRS